jgi:hemerythrin-like metal-binding protein
VGVAKIDEQHKTLIALINGLDEAMRRGEGRSVLRSTLDGLVNYTHTHFAAEESLFEAFCYPQIESHLEQHKEFIDRIDEFQRQYEAGQLMLSVDVMSFLGGWLLNHIRVCDRAFGPFLNQSGVR